MIAVALVVAWLAPAATPPPAAPTAESVLALVQKHYAGAKTLTAGFKQVAIQATFGKSHTSTGKLYLARPDRMRWDYDKAKPPGVDKTFIYDGKTLWIVDHPNLQVIESAAQSSTLPVAIAFLSGTESLGSVTLALDTSGTYGGAGATVLLLTPRQPSALWQQLYMVVDPKDGHVLESVVIQAGGDSNDFTFTNENTRTKVDAKLFQFTPKSLPKYKLVDVTPPATK